MNSESRSKAEFDKKEEGSIPSVVNTGETADADRLPKSSYRSCRSSSTVAVRKKL